MRCEDLVPEQLRDHAVLIHKAPNLELVLPNVFRFAGAKQASGLLIELEAERVKLLGLEVGYSADFPVFRWIESDQRLEKALVRDELAAVDLC